MTDFVPLTAFVIGLLGGVHCLGMCGGVVGALTFGLPEDRRQGVKLVPFQLAYNLEHKIEPRTIQKKIADILADYKTDALGPMDIVMEPQQPFEIPSGADFDQQIKEFEKAMKEAAAQLEFEKAAAIRDQIKHLKEQQLLMGT